MLLAAVDGNTPIANAGPDQTVFAGYDGTAKVTLDGSDSNVAGGTIVAYKWTWTVGGQAYEANGVSPEITLAADDVNTTVTISLVVTSDANLVSAPDTVNITIVPPLEAKLKFTPQALNLGSKGKWVMAHFKLPKGYSGRDVNTVETVYLEPYGVPSHYVHASHGKSPNVEIAFDRGAVSRALGAVDANTADIIVAGQLKSGQYFVGEDTIKLIKKTPKPPKKPKKNA